MGIFSLAGRMVRLCERQQEKRVFSMTERDFALGT
jgi:hypothetical protein